MAGKIRHQPATTVAALAVTLLVAACSSGTQPSGSAPSSTQPSGSAPSSTQPSGSAPSSTSLQGQTITVLVSSGHQQFNPVWETELPKFEASTGITVKLQKVNTTDILTTFLRDVQVGGCTIDNVEMLDGGTAAAAPYMEDLGPYLARDGSSVAALTDAQVGWAVKAMTFGGQLKYYPFYSGSKAIAYRKSLFEDPANQAAFQAKYGYKLPEPPTTPQQLVDLATFFTTGSMKGIVFSGAGDPAETTAADLIFRSGIDGYQDNNGNALWGPKYPANQTTVTTTMKWLTGLMSAGLTPASIPAMQTADTTANYIAGGSAMLYDHIYLSWSKINAPSAVSTIGATGSFEMPNFSASDGGGIAFYWARGIPSCSKHKDASWEFTKWVMSDANQKLALTKGVGTYVPTDKALLAWAVAQNILPQGVADTVTHAKYYKVTTVTNQLRQGIDIPLVEKLIGGQLTPEEYVSQSGSQMQKAAEDAGIVTP